MASTIIINRVPVNISHLEEFLWPTEIQLHMERTKKVPVRIAFSCHCYSRGPLVDETIPDGMLVRDGSSHLPRPRIFDTRRHQLSLHLPVLFHRLLTGDEIVDITDRKNIFRTESLVEMPGEEPINYLVFMQMRKHVKEGEQKILKVYVESAYPEDLVYRDKVRIVRSVAFRRLLGECWENDYPGG